MPIRKIAILGLIIILGHPAGGKGQEAAPAKPILTDFYGDPLPEGAVARLGTFRWRNLSTSLIFSPDGKYLGSGGDEACVFDAGSGKLLHRFQGPAPFLFFAADGRTLITTTTGQSPRVRIWDLNTGKERRQFTVEGGGSFFPHWSADAGLMIGQCFQENRGVVVLFWDMRSAKKIRTWTPPLPARGTDQAALTPDGKRVAIHRRSSLYLHDCITGQELRHFPCELEDSGGPLGTPAFAFSADGKTLACLDKGEVGLWDVDSGKSLRRLQVDKGDRAVSVALPGTGKGQVVAVGTNGGNILVWDRKAGFQRKTFPNLGRNMPVYLVALSPEGQTVAGQANRSSRIRAWDVASGREISPDVPIQPVGSVAFSPDGKIIASVAAGEPIRLWETAGGKVIRGIEGNLAMGNTTSALAIPPDGDCLLMRHYSYLAVWKLADGKKMYETIPDFEGRPFQRQYHLTCSPEAQTVLTVLPGEFKRSAPNGFPIHWTLVGQWHVPGQKISRQFQVEAENLRGLALSPDKKSLAGVGTLPAFPRKAALFIWDIARGRELRHWLLPPGEAPNSLVFFPDSRTVISGPSVVTDSEGKTRLRWYLWEAATGNERSRAESNFVPAAPPLAVHANYRLAALAVNNTIHLVDPTTGKEFHRWHGHEGPITCLAFSRDGKFLATGGSDATVLIWKVPPPRGASVSPPVKEKARLNPRELEQAWTDLAGNDAARAYRAIQLLTRDPDAVLAFMKKRLPPAPGINREKIKLLIDKLNSKEFKVRVQATKELTRLGDLAEPVLKAALAGNISLEVRLRCSKILDTIHEQLLKPPPLPKENEVRELRAVEVLENIGNPEAIGVLENLAGGGLGAILTREAQKALDRLKKKSDGL